MRRSTWWLPLCGCWCAASAECDVECRQLLAETLCAEVLQLRPDGHEDDASAKPEVASEYGKAPGRARLMLPDVFRPILQPRAAAMYHELGCESVRAPPLQSKGVENGKSAMSFLVPGGPGVQAQNAATYSLIIKQLNARLSSACSTSARRR